MAIPDNILREHIERAIKEINPDKIPPLRAEKHYLLIENGKVLPPKYVISIANKFINGQELESNDFNAVEAKKYLKNKNFKVIDKREKLNNVWIEKTHVKGRKDRIKGDRALGKALWSPQTSKNGLDIYKNMRIVQEGDFIIHLVDNKFFSGISVVKEKAKKEKGIKGTDWEGPAYLIELKGYVKLKPKIDRKDLLTEKNKNLLSEISKKSEVFYNNQLNLRQGAYLTPCPEELLGLINQL